MGVEAVFWILKFVIGPVVAIIVTLMVSEPLKTRLAPIVARIGSKKEGSITGKWLATYHFDTEETPRIETIEVSKLLGNYVGHIIPHKRNHNDLKKIENTKCLRLRGEVKDNRFFTGIWFHPNPKNHHQGAFNLLIQTNNEELHGKWLGYNESENVIESGRWEWKRIEEETCKKQVYRP